MIKRLAYLISLIIFFSSCQKDEEAVVSNRGFKAEVDGAKWKARDVQASIYNGTIVVIGEASDGSQIIISLSGDTVGTYDVNEETTSSATYWFVGGKGFTSGGNSNAGGQVVIEEISKRDRTITGTIEFDAVRAADDSTIKITNGKFNKIRFENVAIGLEDNVLKTKVNGNNWSPQDVSGFVAFKTIFLQASDADGVRVLTFELPELIGPGDYTLNYFTKYKAVYTDVSGKNYYATDGNLEIISHNLVNRQIEAKFDIRVEAHEGGGTAQFSEGEFTIIYE